MAYKILDIVTIVVLNTIHSAQSDNFLSCDPHSLLTCPDNKQYCNQTSLRCECEDRYIMVGQICELPYQNKDHSILVAVVSVLTAVLIICGIVLVALRYKLVQYVLGKVSATRDIAYEDVTIGEDDPPLRL